MQSNPIQKPNSGSQLSLVLTALRRHSLLVIATSLLLAGIGGAIVWYTFEPVYEAKSFLHVIQNPEYFQIVPEKNQVKTEAKNELAPLRSDLVLRRVLANEEVQRQPSFAGAEMTVDDLRRRIRFASAGGVEHFEVIATSRYPKEAVALVTAVTDSYLDFFRNYRNSLLEDLDKSLNEEIKVKNQRIDELNAQVSSMFRDMQGKSNDNALFDPDGQFLNELKKTRAGLESEKSILEHEQKSIQETLDSKNFPIDDAFVQNFVEQSTELSGLQARRADVEKQMRESRFGPGHAKYLELERSLSQVNQSIQTLRGELAARGRALMVAEQIQKLTADLAETKDKIAALQIKIDYYDQEVTTHQNLISVTNQKRAEYELKKSDLERVREEYNKLADAASAIRLRKLSLPFQISQSSTTKIEMPTRPVEQYPWKLWGIVGVASFLLPLGLAFLWELRACRIVNGEQFSSSEKIKLLGEVACLPRVTKRSNRNASSDLTREMRLYQESIDNVSALLTIDQPNRPHTLAVTSAATHEGKSTLSSQLAISLARAHYGRVLLVDTDLRSPTQHRLFDRDLAPGLSEVLEQGLLASEAIHELTIENLFLLTAGRVKSNPRRCFSGREWEDFLNEMKSRFDIIIVDTPPVLATSESILISKSCDAALVCLLRDVSLAESTRRAYRRLRDGGVNVIGCVMGGVPQSEYSYRYGSYGYNLSR